MSRTVKAAGKGPEASESSAPPAPPWVTPAVAGVVAWLIPGGGHWLLGRRGRGLAFFGLVVGALVIGASLDGKLGAEFFGAPPLTQLRTLGCLGAGLPYGVLRTVFDYAGSALAPGYEYGSAFLVSAGLMNYMLVLDAFDIACGRKE